jgi:hypothetical protein
MITYKNDSNYASTDSNNKYLELYNPPLIQENLDDRQTKVRIQQKYHRRPDLFAQDYLGNSRLWWVLAHYNRNTIKDPVMDFTSGTVIRVPKGYNQAGAR